MKRNIAVALLFICLFVGQAAAQLNKPYFFTKGRELIMDKDYRGAIEMLNMLLRSQPKEYEGYALRGIAKYNLDDLTGAEADFSSAIRENPVYTMAFQYRAIARSRMGRYQEALEDFATAIDLRPSQASIYYSRGVTLFLNQQFEAAIIDLNRYLGKYPTDVNALTNRGAAYLYLQDTTRAMADFNRAVQINPSNAEGFMRRGLLSVVRNDYNNGIRDLSEAIRLDTTMAVAYFYRGMAYSSQKRPVEAINDFTQAINYDSTNSVTFFNRAILRSQIGDYNRAIEDYDRVALYNPSNVLVVYNRATVKAQIGDYRGAIGDYSRAIEIYPDFANAYRFRSQLKAMTNDMPGADSDRKIADAKIAEFRNKISDSSFNSWADTSRQFNSLVAFDADFGNKDMRKMVGDPRSEVRLLPLFRLTATAPPVTNTHNRPNIYQNARLEQYCNGLSAVVQNTADSIPAPPWYGLSNTISPIPANAIAEWDMANNNPEGWRMTFLKALTQGLMRQFTSSLTYYRRAANQDGGNNPIVFMNTGVTQAEMIDFMASLNENMAIQNIAISGNSDPATDLRASNGNSRRSYDYSEAILQMERAAELMPELPHAHYNMGVLYFKSNNLPAAIEAFNRAIELFPYFAEAYYNRGVVQIYMGDTHKGCLDLSKAGELGLDAAYEVISRSCVKQ